jgi:Undecaprenyl-phosphate galactose phosphotransferase WbaP
VEGIPVVSARAPIEALLKHQRIQYAVFIDLDDGRQAHQNEVLRWLSETFPTVLIVLQNSPLGSLWVRTMDLEGRLTLKTTYHLLDKRAELAKRAFDVAFGLLIGLATLPFYLAIALLIRLDSPGPAVFAQERLGRAGRRFPCYKFRTMMAEGAEEALQKLLETDPTARLEYQKYHKLAHDPRITRVGSMLRKFSLDELPQIWNVLRGDLSLVGPRAYLPRELADMQSDANLILKTRPGLTGWWQVMGRHSTTFEQRLQLDIYYLSTWSLWLDIYILIKTAWIIMSGHGA